MPLGAAKHPVDGGGEERADMDDAALGVLTAVSLVLLGRS